MAKVENGTVTIDNSEALQKLTDVIDCKAKTVPGVKFEAETETIVIFKVNRPLMPHEYEELEKRVRQENEKSGLKIVLAPYSVDVELTGS